MFTLLAIIVASTIALSFGKVAAYWKINRLITSTIERMEAYPRKVTRFLTIAVLTIILLIASTVPVSAKGSTVSTTSACGVGYVFKNGKCRPIKITTSRATRIASCILKGGGHGTTKQQMAQLMKCYRIK